MAYEDMTHAELRLARDQPGADQQALAPAEHQAFAREFAAESPLQALSLVPAIPAYQLAKGIGAIGSRTGASQPVEQMAAGYRGLGQGWGAALRRLMESSIPSAEAAAPSAPANTDAIGVPPRRKTFSIPPPTRATLAAQGFNPDSALDTAAASRDRVLGRRGPNSLIPRLDRADIDRRGPMFGQTSGTVIGASPIDRRGPYFGTSIFNK